MFRTIYTSFLEFTMFSSLLMCLDFEHSKFGIIYIAGVLRVIRNVPGGKWGGRLIFVAIETLLLVVIIHFDDLHD